MGDREETSRGLVAVTGTGLAVPPGMSVDHSWTQWMRGKSAIALSRRFDSHSGVEMPAAEVPSFELGASLRVPKNEKFMSVGVRLAVRAAQSAVASAQLDVKAFDPYRVAIFIGSGQTGLASGEFFDALEAGGGHDEASDFASLGGRASRALDPYFPLRTLSNAGVGLLSIELQARGPSDNFVQDDTASAMAVRAGVRELLDGRCDVAIVGGYDSLLTASQYLTYKRAGLLSAMDADRAYRPFDRDRDGLVLGEGAGFLVLERDEDARRRGASPIGHILGVGSAMELDDVASAKASASAMHGAIERATDGRHVDAVVAHGIGMPDGDRREAALLQAILGVDTPVTALKSLTGYLGAATAAVELILALRAARERTLPAIVHLERIDEDCRLNLVREQPRALGPDMPTVLCLSWSWFGACAAVAVRGC